MLELDEYFLKKKILQNFTGQNEKAENFMKMKIENEDLIVSVKVSKNEGLYMQVQSRQKKELLLINRLQKNDDDNIVHKMSGLVWSSSIKQPDP